MIESSPERVPVEQLAEEFLERHRRGEKPSITEYTDKYPDLAGEINDLFPALVMMEDLKPVSESPNGSATAAGSEPGALATGASTGSSTTTRKKLERLGDYRILREVGRGGMGIVYEAEQISLGRRVALKVLPAQSMLDSRQQQRFQREAKAAARLHHTNIVPVFGVGEHDGLHYYVMQFINGLGLDEVLVELKRLRKARSASKALKGESARVREGAPREGEAPAEPISRRGSAGASPSRQKPELVSGPTLPAAEVAQALMTGQFAVSNPHRLTESPATGPEQLKIEDVGWVESSEPTSAWKKVGSEDSTHPTSRSSILDPRSSTESGRHYWQSVARIGVQVADALDYAHGQGIFHRDIKPSNLLLDNQGTVWVTDFGLAKASADGENLTHTGDILGTLRYMAPERFKGQSDARCDIYSLGLTLYELLVQRPAFDETDRNKLIHQVTHEEPIRPRKSNPAIPRDVETIVLKSIEREPSRRYPTARALAEDLKRFVDDKPILARQVSSTERLLRWCRRNPALAGSMAGIAALLLIGCVASTIAALRLSNLANREIAAREQAEYEQRKAESAQKREAEQHRQAEANLAKAREAVDYFTGVAENDLLKIPGALSLRRQVLQKAKTYYEDFLKDRGDDPALQTELAAAYLRMGRIGTDLGQYVEVRETFLKAIAGYEAAASKDPNSPDLQDRLADAWQALGDADYFGDRRSETGLTPYQKAVQIRKALVQKHPGNAGYQEKLATMYNRLGITQSDFNRQPAEAVESYRMCIEIRLQLARENPSSPTLQYGLGESFLNFGTYLGMHGHQQESLAMILRSQDFYRAACVQMPHMVEYALDLGSAYQRAADAYWNLGEREKALEQFQRGTDHYLARVRSYPDVPGYRNALAYDMGRQLTRLREIGHKEQALGVLRQVSQALDELPEPSGSDLYLLASLQAQSATFLGFGKQELTPEEKARERQALDQARVTFHRALSAGFNDSNRVKNDLNVMKHDPNWKGLRERNPDWFLAVEKQIRKGFTADTPVADKKPAKGAESTPGKTKLVNGPVLTQDDLARSRLAIGLLKADFGELQQSAQALAEALAICQELVKSDPKNTQYQEDLASIQFSLGHLDWRAGRVADAVRRWQDALKPMHEALRNSPENQPRATRLASFEVEVGNRYAEIGLWSEAADFYRKSFARHESGNALDWAFCAPLLLLDGDVKGYQRLTAQMLEKFGHTPQVQWIFEVIYGAALREMPAEQAARWLQTAETGVTVETNPEWRMVKLALVQYRAGRFQDALKSVDQGLHRNDGWPIKAMILQRLGRPEAAREWLAKTDDWSKKSLQDVLARDSLLVPAQPWWRDWAAFQILRREAHELIDGSQESGNPGGRGSRRAADQGPLRNEEQGSAGASPSRPLPPWPQPRLLVDDPWQRLLRGRAYAKLGLKEKADREFQAAVSLDPKGAEIWTARAKLFAQLGQFDRAEGDFAKAIEWKPDDSRPWIARGRFFMERGQAEKADADFTKAASLTPHELNKFIEAGWWIIGPYPEELQTAWPPEKDPDPSRTPGADATRLAGADGSKAAGAGGPQLAGAKATPLGDAKAAPRVEDTVRLAPAVPLMAQPDSQTISGRVGYDLVTKTADSPRWIAARTDLFGRVDLRTHFNFDHVSAYALNYVYSPEERTATLMVGGDDLIRVWLNGRLIHEIPDRLSIWPWGLDRVPVTLRAGRNTILVKVSNIVGPFGFHLRLGDYPVDRAFDDAPFLRWKEAKEQFAKMRDEDILSDPHLWRLHTLLLFLSGEKEAYRAACARIMERNGEAREWWNVAGMIYLFGLTEEVPADWPKLVQKAERWLAEEKENKGWALIHLGLAHYRAGQFDKAIQILSKPENKGVMTWPILAMAHHRLGHSGEARRWLAKVDQEYERVTREALASSQFRFPWYWADFAQLLILRREAKTLVEGNPPKSDPNFDAIQAHARKVLQGVDKATRDYDLAVLAQPKDGRLLMARVQRLVDLQSWSRAADEAHRASELWPNIPYFIFEEACLRLQLGDAEGYRQICSQMLEKFGQSTKEDDIAVLAHACVLAPGTLGDSSRVRELAEKRMARTPPNSAHHLWSVHVLGLAYYRAGLHEKAVECLQKGLAENPDWREKVVNWLVLSMAHERLNHGEEARKWRTQAQEWIDQHTPRGKDSGFAPDGWLWRNWMMAQMLLREANGLKNQSPPSAN